ncbi:mitogen-activated protein kinase kinase kinase 7 isoform X1 [Drosophila mojavensis]|nr:mitogen-activated protein kinase kinase kinase 7 isoform X1 [Drosophila mojavensis]
MAAIINPKYIIGKKELLGEGSYGKVYTVELKVAIKELKSSEAEKIKSFEAEATNLLRAQHPNIIRLYGISGKHTLVMEYADNTLDKYIHNEENKITELHRQNLMLQCAEGVAYLHSLTPLTLHRDLKPANILLTNDNCTLKICDFGTAREIRTEMTAEKGTAVYRAPEIIDKGFFGVSKAARLKDSSSKKVIRFIKIEDTQQGEFEAEINTFIQIKHDNVLSVNMVKSPYQNFLVMDFSEFGSLYKILHVNKDLLSDLLLLNWAQQLLLGIRALHDKNIVHGNLGTRNLFLFDDNMVLKICLDPTKTCGAPISAYTAPEILKYGRRTTRSDVYSFGIILWELLSRKIPFNDTTDQILASMILSGKRPDLEEMKKYRYIEVLRSVIKQCWNEDPNKRPAVNILNLIFKYDYDEIKILERI